MSFAIVAGTLIGTLTGFVRGWTDRIIMAFNNALLAFPGLLLAQLWTPHDPLKINFAARLKPPGGGFLLGTDEFGRDELSRLLAGASSSVWISLLTVSFAIVAGTLIGTLTGFVRGWTDRIIMAFNNALLAFPGLLLALGLLAVVGPTSTASSWRSAWRTRRRSRASCAAPCCPCAKRNSSNPRACWAIPSCTRCGATCCRTASRR